MGGEGGQRGEIEGCYVGEGPRCLVVVVNAVVAASDKSNWVRSREPGKGDGGTSESGGVLVEEEGLTGGGVGERD